MNASDNEDGEKGGMNMFNIKSKDLDKIENESKEFDKFVKKVESKSKKDKTDIKAIKKFWGNETNLDDNEKFLKKFIMTKGWIDRDDVE